MYVQVHQHLLCIYTHVYMYVSMLCQVAKRDPLLYGDYRTALQPEQPRIYEDIQDYEAAKGLFDEVQCGMITTLRFYTYTIICIHDNFVIRKYISQVNILRYIHVCTNTLMPA